MWKLFITNVCCLLFSAQAQAEMSISSIDPSSRQEGASVSIRIRVHIPVHATLKLSADARQMSSETNLQEHSSLIVGCNNQQGLPLAKCSAQPSGQVVYTLTIL